MHKFVKMIRTRYILNIALLLLMGATTMRAQTIKGNIYGGGNLAQVEGCTTINIKSGEITIKEVDGAEDGNIYGGGYGASAVLTGNTTINVTGGTIAKDVYGGGSQAAVEGYTDVNINSGGTTLSKKVEIKGDVFGGGMSAPVSEHTNVYIKGSTVDGYVYGGGSQGTVGSARAEDDPKDYTKVIVDQSEVKKDVFGGGYGAEVTGNTAVWIKGIDCFIHGSVLGGGFGGDVTGDTHVQIGARDVNGDGEDDDLYPESLLSGGR